MSNSQRDDEQSKNISATQPGDIVLDIDETATGRFNAAANNQDILSILPRLSNHLSVFVDRTKGRIAHASPGENFFGAMSNDLVRKITKKEAATLLGEMVVLACKNQIVTENLAKAAKRWTEIDRRIILELPRDAAAETLAAAIENAPKPINLHTKFAPSYARRQDSTEAKTKLACYRAFRAHFRNHSNELELPRALSKQRGVDCVNFLIHSLHTAIIDTFLPKDLIMSIRKELLMVEQIKSHKKYSKLSQLRKDEKIHFDNIESIVQDFLLSQKDTANFKDLNSFINFLFMPTKGLSIRLVMKEITTRFSNLIEFKGYLFFKNEAKPGNLNIMNHETFLALSKLPYYQNEPPTIIVPQAHIDEALAALALHSKYSQSSSASSQP